MRKLNTPNTHSHQTFSHNQTHIIWCAAGPHYGTETTISRHMQQQQQQQLQICRKTKKQPGSSRRIVVSRLVQFGTEVRTWHNIYRYMYIVYRYIYIKHVLHMHASNIYAYEQTNGTLHFMPLNYAATGVGPFCAPQPTNTHNDKYDAMLLRSYARCRSLRNEVVYLERWNQLPRIIRGVYVYTVHMILWCFESASDANGDITRVGCVVLCACHALLLRVKLINQFVARACTVHDTDAVRVRGPPLVLRCDPPNYTIYLYQ